MGSAWALDSDLKIICSTNTYVGRFAGLGQHGEIGLELKNRQMKYLAASDEIQQLMRP